MSSDTQTTQHGSQVITTQPRRAVDIAREINAKPPEAVFDAFWRDGELALLFGEAGSGKSLLAVQIGDAIARGKQPLEMRSAEGGVRNLGEKRSKRRKVLYVDLVLSDRQFSARYGRYRFSANLYRDRPESTVDLAAWVRASIEKTRFTAVIIDDLSMVSLTDDGTRETLRLMRELRAVTVETGVPILVLADSFPAGWGRDISELNLRRSRVLCGVADSVFAIDFAEGLTTPASGHPSSDRRGVGVERAIVQMRSRGGELVWTHSWPMWGDIKVLENGLLGFELTPHVEEEARDNGDRDVLEMHDEEGMTFRAIAAELNISKSTAQRVYAERKAEVKREQEDRERRVEEARAYHAELQAWKAEGGLIDYDYTQNRWVKAGKKSGVLQSGVEESGVLEAGVLESGGSGEWNVEDIPFAAGLARRHITDLEQAWDDYGHEIFVDEWNPHTHKPSVWYKRTPQGFSKLTRTTWGTNVRRLERGMEFC